MEFLDDDDQDFGAPENTGPTRNGSLRQLRTGPRRARMLITDPWVIAPLADGERCGRPVHSAAITIYPRRFAPGRYGHRRNRYRHRKLLSIIA